MKRPKKKTPAAKAAGATGVPAIVPAPDKIEQLHGGALLAGGSPGNAGGGRLPSLTREACRLSFDKRITLLEQIADGDAIKRIEIEGVVTIGRESADIGDRIRAIEMLGKYGLGAAKDVSVDSVRERVQKTLDIVEAHTNREQNLLIVRELQAVWG